MSGQLESNHFLRERDLVERYGMTGRVTDASALYASVRWEDGSTEEVEQFDPRIVVIERASG